MNEIKEIKGNLFTLILSIDLAIYILTYKAEGHKLQFYTALFLIITISFLKSFKIKNIFKQKSDLLHMNLMEKTIPYFLFLIFVAIFVHILAHCVFLRSDLNNIFFKSETHVLFISIWVLFLIITLPVFKDWVFKFLMFNFSLFFTFLVFGFSLYDSCVYSSSFIFFLLILLGVLIKLFGYNGFYDLYIREFKNK